MATQTMQDKLAKEAMNAFKNAATILEPVVNRILYFNKNDYMYSNEYPQLKKNAKAAETFIKAYAKKG